jgi:hypothetical protein
LRNVLNFLALFLWLQLCTYGKMSLHKIDIGLFILTKKDHFEFPVEAFIHTCSIEIIKFAVKLSS